MWGGDGLRERREWGILGRQRSRGLITGSLWGHTHSSAREASLSWETPQPSGTILPWGPRRARVTLGGEEK